MMKTLTQDQIQAVIDWMNNWDQLKGTSIPIRFKEDWMKQVDQNNERPPIGLTPKFIHDQERMHEIFAAINRYNEAGVEIPNEWWQEFNLICQSNT